MSEHISASGENNKQKKTVFSRLPRPRKKTLLMGIPVVAAGVLLVSILGTHILPFSLPLGNQQVDFEALDSKSIPQAIEKDVIPQYRDLERALGCLVDGSVYVIVTRGEKPTAGYDLTIKEIHLEDQKDSSNLVVTAMFQEPSDQDTVSHIITYPYIVAKTDLTTLPKTIELNVQYAQ